MNTVTLVLACLLLGGGGRGGRGGLAAASIPNYQSDVLQLTARHQEEEEHHFMVVLTQQFEYRGGQPQIAASIAGIQGTIRIIQGWPASKIC